MLKNLVAQQPNFRNALAWLSFFTNTDEFTNHLKCILPLKTTSVYFQEKLATLAMEAHRQYGTSLMMESSDLITDGGSEEKNTKEEVDFFSQDFVAHQSNSSCSISQDAFINSGSETILGRHINFLIFIKNTIVRIA